MLKHLFLGAWMAVLAVPFALSAQPQQVPGGGRTLRASDLIRVVPRRVPNGNKPVEALQLKIHGFLNQLKTGQTKEAYNRLLKGSRIAQQPDKVELLVAKTEQAFAVYGKMIKYEPFDTYEVGSSVVVVTYLTNLPVQPLRWRFVYYKPAEDWTIIDVRVDDVLVDLLDD